MAISSSRAEGRLRKQLKAALHASSFLGTDSEDNVLRETNANANTRARARAVGEGYLFNFPSGGLELPLYSQSSYACIGR